MYSWHLSLKRPLRTCSFERYLTSLWYRSRKWSRSRMLHKAAKHFKVLIHNSNYWCYCYICHNVNLISQSNKNCTKKYLVIHLKLQHCIQALKFLPGNSNRQEHLNHSDVIVTGWCIGVDVKKHLCRNVNMSSERSSWIAITTQIPLVKQGDKQFWSDSDNSIDNFCLKFLGSLLISVLRIFVDPVFGNFSSK